jgi:hypothetical protein
MEQETQVMMTNNVNLEKNVTKEPVLCRQIL